MKRVFDIVCSSIGLIILFPVFLMIAIWIKVDSSGAVMFRQVRVGRHGIPFSIHKFRTMELDADVSGRLTVGSDARITRAGRFLRKAKLDELPQLIDVLLGHMSLVGPRPEVQEFIDCYPDDVRQKILSVRPGITDYASIEMVDESDILAQYEDPRSAYINVILPLKQKFYLRYVDNQSLYLDVILILKTLWKIVRR